MTIVDYGLSVETIPLKTPFITALRRVDHVEFLRLQMISDEGYIGIGEAPPTKAITGEDLASISHAVKQLILPNLMHRPLKDMQTAQTLLHEIGMHHSSAKAAVDIALHDLFAQHSGQTMLRYLGGHTGSVMTDVTISLNKPKTMASDAVRAVNDGFTILKVKVGGKDGEDTARIRAVQTSVPEATLLIDANQAWDEQETLDILGKISPSGIALIEQPVHAHRFDALQRITAASPIPILADESVFTLDDTRRLITKKAADMINIKLMKCGGIAKAVEIIKLCAAHNVPCMMGSMLEGPYSIAAAIRLCLAYPDTIRYCDLDSPFLYDILPEGSPVAIHASHLSLPKG